MNFRKKILGYQILILCKIVVFIENWVDIHTIRHHSVWAKPISQASTIVDLGSNKGDFSKYFFDRNECSVFCVEPNPQLAEYVAKSLFADVSNLAITDHPGEFDFTLSENLEASSLSSDLASLWGETQTIKISGISLEEYLREKSINNVSLLKIDIEGAEIDILKKIGRQTLEQIDQLTVEFHDFLDSSLIPDVEEIINKLENFGFICLCFDYPRHENTLFVSKKILSRKKYWLDYFLLITMKHFLKIKGKWQQRLQYL